MKSVTIYTPGSTKAYYYAFYRLHEEGKMNVELINSRWLYQLLIKINNHSALFRHVRRIITNKSNKVKDEPSAKDIIKSFFAPILLPFKENIILGFNPYDNIVYYLIFLKILGKNIIFENSCNYWNTGSYIKKPFLISKFLWKALLRNTKTFSCNKATLESMKKYHVKPFYLPHSIDTDVFKPKTHKNKRIKLLYVGRLIEEKGIIDLLEVSKKLSNCDLTIVGDGPLKERISIYPDTTIIPFVSDKKELAKIYASSDIFILNSYATKDWEEWFGIVLLEAMSCEMACISTDCIGPREIITSNKDGIIIPQKDKKALEQAIRQLVSNKSLRHKLGKEARKKVVKDFNIKKLSALAEKII